MESQGQNAKPKPVGSLVDSFSDVVNGSVVRELTRFAVVSGLVLLAVWIGSAIGG